MKIPIPMLADAVIENNCDLVGVFSIVIQANLVLMVFSAVKRMCACVT